MLRRIWERLRRAGAGPRLRRAIDNNDRAATELDALLREVLKR